MDNNEKIDIVISSIKTLNDIKKRHANGIQLAAHDIEWLISMTELYFKSKQ